MEQKPKTDRKQKTAQNRQNPRQNPAAPRQNQTRPASAGPVRTAQPRTTTQPPRSAQSRQQSAKTPFKKRDKRPADRRLMSPATGRFMTITDVSDPVYAQRLFGDGMAVAPEDDIIVSPVTGTVVMIPWTKHAVGLESENQESVLVHLGMNTALYKGKGIELLVSEGVKVRPGTPIAKMDRRLLENMGLDTTVMMVVTNQNPGDYQILETEGLQAGKTPVMEKKNAPAPQA